MIGTLPHFVRDLLESPPRAGKGVHLWLFRVARQLHAHLPAVDIIRLLDQQVSKCGRLVSRREIEEAVANSLRCTWQPRGRSTSGTTNSGLKWPLIDQERRSAIIRDGGGLADLWESSPTRIEDNQPHSESLIDALFPGNPLLCCGWSSSRFDTRLRADWSGELAGLQLIVPSAMLATNGLTKDGRESAHALSNTGARRFLVCEFDTGTPDDHAALLLHLGTFAPLVCAVHSGGKSLHGWFYVHGQPDAKVEKFFRYAVALGADAATWTRSQFVRMPDGTRDNGKRQKVFFQSFKPLEAQ